MIVNGYRIDAVCANFDEETGGYGDIYTDMEQCRKEHPKDRVIVGYYAEKEGEETPDWFETIGDAIVYALTGEECYGLEDEDVWNAVLAQKMQ